MKTEIDDLAWRLYTFLENFYAVERENLSMDQERTLRDMIQETRVELEVEVP